MCVTLSCDFGRVSRPCPWPGGVRTGVKGWAELQDRSDRKSSGTPRPNLWSRQLCPRLFLPSALSHSHPPGKLLASTLPTREQVQL